MSDIFADVEIGVTLRVISAEENAVDAAAMISEFLRQSAITACETRLGHKPFDITTTQRVTVF